MHEISCDHLIHPNNFFVHQINPPNCNTKALNFYEAKKSPKNTIVESKPFCQRKKNIVKSDKK